MKEIANKKFEILNIFIVLLSAIIAGFISYFLLSYLGLDYKVIIGLFVLLAPLYFLFKYPGITFGLFLVAGYFKADPRLENILPDFLDFTVFLGLIVGFSILLNIIKRQFKLPWISSNFFIPYFLLVISMLASLLYTESSVYGQDKFLRFVIITTLAAFGPMFLLENRKRMHYFFYALIGTSTLMVIDSIISTWGKPGVHTAFGSNYLALGRITGITSLIVLYYFLLLRKGKKKKIFWALLLVLNLFGLLYSGGRAPVIVFIITLLLLGLIALAPKVSMNKFKLIKITSLFLLISFLIFILSPEPFLKIFLRVRIMLTQEKGGISISKRLNSYKSAIRAFYERPILGLGIGGFGIYHSGIDGRLYPHNILLEIGSELGILGLISFTLLIGFCFFYLINLRKKHREKEKYFLITTILALFIFMLMNTSVSGDINDNRVFFVWLGVAYSLQTILGKDSLPIEKISKEKNKG